MGESCSNGIVMFYIYIFACFIIVSVGAFRSKLSARRLEQELHRAAIDELTGVYNREYFFDNVERILKKSEGKYYLVCTNISGFKFFNEIFGKRKGDEVLKTQAMMLRERENSYAAYGRLVAEEGKVLGAEALVRWKHPEEGVISPGEFVPVLEEASLITKLDYFVWEQAARLLRKWKKEGREWLYISVNVSAMDFLCLDICQTFILLVQKYDINPVNLKIEITESVFMNEAKTQIDTLNRLQEYGFEIEIDDFGSGYSSLNMLKDIMADVMKIDMGFLLETVHEERSWIILQGIVNLAERLGMRTVAEGVETECQKKKLVDIGCNVFQGYYFAKPMPTEEFAKRYLC